MTLIRANQLVEIELDGAQRKAALERAVYAVRWDWFGRAVEMRCDRSPEIDALRSRYRAFLTNDRPLMTSCAFAQDGEPPKFFTEPGPAFAHPMVLDRPGVIAFLADAVTTRAFFDVHPSLNSFHAAAVRIGDGAAAISAISTGGKSTTAFACARRGMGLYSDERCVLRGEEVLPFPRAVNLRAGGIELLTAQAVPDDRGLGETLRLHRGEDWESAQLSDVLGMHALPRPAKLAAIFFITARAARPHAEPLELETSLPLLLEAAFAGPPPGMDRVAAAMRVLRQARAFALTLGMPDDTALLIAQTVSNKRLACATGSA